MQNCGIFNENLINLDNCFKEVRTVWNDDTAASFEVLNENIEEQTAKVWAHLKNAEMGFQAVQKNYDEDEFDNILSQLSGMVSSV